MTSTFLSLFVLPALYLRFGGQPADADSPEEELMHRWAGVGPRPRRTAVRASSTAACVDRRSRRPPTPRRRRHRETLAPGRWPPASRVAGVSPSACKEVEEESAAGYEPSKLEPIKGKSEDFQRVTFTDEGARRIGPPDGSRSAAAAGERWFPTPR